MSKIITAFLVFVAVLAVAVSGYFYYFQTGSGLEISVITPEVIMVGAPFSVKVGISNDSRGALDDARASLSLPPGVVFAGSPKNKTSNAKILGKIGAGSIIETEFLIMVLGGEDASSTKNITASVSYLTSGVTSRFEQSKDAQIVATGQGLIFNIVAPEKIVAGEDFSFEISYKNISDNDLRGLELAAEYPAGFEFKKATLAPDLGQNIWRLGDLRKGSAMKFKITGNLLGPDSSVHDFRAVISGEFAGESYSLASAMTKAQLGVSQLTLKISVNGGDQNLVVAPGGDLRYLIYYTNNSDLGLRDAVISAQLSGDMYDFTTLQTVKGVLSLSGNSIVWNSLMNPELAVISPHASGVVEFSVKAKNTYPIKRLSDKNFTLKVGARLESAVVGSDSGAGKTVGVAQIENKVRGAIAVDARGFFRDAATGILNKGILPPKVGQPTNYTIHWVITNYGTDISDVNLSAKLPMGIVYTGISKTNAMNDVVYNSGTQIVAWHLDKVPATRGLVDKPMELIFQIEAVPVGSQLGSYMPLISETTITAKDDFTGSDLSATDGGIISALPDDVTIGGRDGIVIP